MAHLDAAYVRRRFPTIEEMCRRIGLDLARDPIPVGPAAHYIMGGVDTDAWGRTSLPALYAAGEVACTGVHGANRLASNSLLEGLVFGARAAIAMSDGSTRPAVLKAVDAAPLDLEAPGPADVPTAGQVQDLMWQHVGLSRDEAGLRREVGLLHAWQRGLTAARMGRPFERELRRLGSLVAVGTLIAHAALRRQESRGGHFRTDFPRRDDLHWQKRVADVRQPAGTRTTAAVTLAAP
jgi:L-aspartate oxidase